MHFFSARFAPSSYRYTIFSCEVSAKLFEVSTRPPTFSCRNPIFSAEFLRNCRHPAPCCCPIFSVKLLRDFQPNIPLSPPRTFCKLSCWQWDDQEEGPLQLRHVELEEADRSFFDRATSQYLTAGDPSSHHVKNMREALQVLLLLLASW